jgi:hypothetical protein
MNSYADYCMLLCVSLSSCMYVCSMYVYMCVCSVGYNALSEFSVITLGISTGGVAEVFETNCPSGDEVILLQERRGLIKLAFRTGAELVPWFVFLSSPSLSIIHSFLRYAPHVIASNGVYKCGTFFYY